MREFRRILVEKLRRDDQQPRKYFDPEKLKALGSSLRTIKQQVPIIVVGDVVIDGEMRLRAAILEDIKELDAIVLDQRPTSEELLVIQTSIDLHRASLRPMERAAAIDRLHKEGKRSLNEVFDCLKISQSMGSKLLSCTKLAPEIQAMLDAGDLDLEKAYIISQEPDHTKQKALTQKAASLTRDQFRRRARGAEMRTHKVAFPLPSGSTVILTGTRLALKDVLEALIAVMKELRVAHKANLDVLTAASVMRDKAGAQ